MFRILFPNSKILTVTVVISVCMCILLLVVKVYVSFSFLPDISGSEGSTILPIQRLADNLAIYTNPEESPFLMTQYTPIYFLLTSSLINLAGFSPSDVHKIFVVSRLLSIALTILSTMVVWLLIFKKTRGNKTFATLSACFIFQILALWFLTSSRPDSLLVLMTSLFLIVVYFATQAKKKTDILWILAIFIAVTAFFVKQSGMIHSIALGLFCISRKDWKLLFKLVGFGILFFILYLLILPISEPELFFLNIVGSVANSISWDWFYDWTLQKFLFQFAPLLAINFAICLYNFQIRESTFQQFLAICSISFFLFATLTALKIGAGVGYYQDYLIVTVVQIVTFASRNPSDTGLRNSLITWVSCAYLVFVSVYCLLFVFMSYTKQPLASFKQIYAEQRAVANYLKDDLQITDRQSVYICGGENYRGYYINHFLYRNALIPFADIVYLADRNNTFNFENLTQMIHNKEIRYVISIENNEPVTILGHKFKGLKKIHTITPYDIYQVVD